MNKQVIKIVLALAIGGIMNGIVEAQSAFTSGIIDINLYSSSFFPETASGAGAIGNSGDIWNNVDLAGLPIHGSGLVNNSGTVTTVGLNFPSTSVGGVGPNGTYAFLFDVWVNLASSTVEQITGLAPNSQYDLFLYQSSQTVSGVVGVNGVSFSSTPASVPENTLILGSGFSSGVVTSDGSGDLNITAPSGGNFSALQLTPVATPEPSTLALAGIGAASLLAYRRRK